VPVNDEDQYLGLPSSGSKAQVPIYLESNHLLSDSVKTLVMQGGGGGFGVGNLSSSHKQDDSPLALLI
jgi:hypothetical protein